MAFIVATPTVRSPKRSLPPPRHAPSASLPRRTALLLPLLLLPHPALADRTYQAARRSFDRYHPRILAAIDTLRAIRDTVSTNDPAAANALISDRQFNVRARRAFAIYATGFSDNYLGPRSRGLLKSADDMFNELAFVGRGEDMAVHYGKAVERLGEYYRDARLPVSEIEGLGI